MNALAENKVKLMVSYVTNCKREKYVRDIVGVKYCKFRRVNSRNYYMHI